MLFIIGLSQAYGKAFYWGAGKIALKKTICSKNEQFALIP